MAIHTAQTLMARTTMGISQRTLEINVVEICMEIPTCSDDVVPTSLTTIQPILILPTVNPKARRSSSLSEVVPLARIINSKVLVKLLLQLNKFGNLLDQSHQLMDLDHSVNGLSMVSILTSRRTAMLTSLFSLRPSETISIMRLPMEENLSS